MKEQMIRGGAVQFQHKASDKAYNFSRIEHFVNEAVQQEVQIVSFPEACISGYWHVPELSREALADLSESVPNGPSTKRLVQMAQESGIIIGAGLFERSRGKFYNTYVVASPDGQVHKHRKIHAFEGPHMSSGKEHTVFDTHLGAKVGVLTCYDNMLIENQRIVALKGTDILLAPHQTGGTNSRSYKSMQPIDSVLWENRETEPEAIEAAFRGRNGREWLIKWLPAEAFNNGYYVIFSNGVGWDNGEIRTGNAMINDPGGEIMVETWKARDEMVVADCDLSVLPNSNGRRKIWGRHPELYRPLLDNTNEVVEPFTARFKLRTK